MARRPSCTPPRVALPRPCPAPVPSMTIRVRTVHDGRAARRARPVADGRRSAPRHLVGNPGRPATYHRGMVQLTRADVEHVAHLARLGLTDEELARLEGELNHILDQYATPRRAGHGPHPADRPGHRAREHPARGRRSRRRCRPRARPRATRPQRDGRLLRRARDPGRRTDPWPALPDADELTTPAAPRAGRRAACRRDDRRASSRRRTSSRAPRTTGPATPGSRSTTTGPSPRPMPPTPASPPPAPRARGRSPPSTRSWASPWALKDLVSVEGRQCTAGSPHPRGLPGPVRRPHRGAAARRRRRHPGQDQHGRVRDGLLHGALGVRAHRQPWDLRPRPGRLVGRLGGRRRRLPCAAGRSARTPAAPSASPRRSAGSWGSSPPMAGSAATGSSRSPPRSTRSARSARDVRDAAALLHAIAGRDERDSTSAPVPVPDDAAPAAGLGRRGCRLAPGPAPGAAARVLREGMEPGVEARDPRGGSGPRGRRRDGRGGQPARTRTTASRRTTSWPRPRRPRTSPATTACASAPASRGRGLIADYLATRGERLRTGGQAPDHARDVRAVGRLLRRVLPQGAEGADAHQARLRPRCGSTGFDAIVAPWRRTVAFAVRREARRPGGHVPRPTPARCP